MFRYVSATELCSFNTSNDMGIHALLSSAYGQLLLCESIAKILEYLCTRNVPMHRPTPVVGRDTAFLSQ